MRTCAPGLLEDVRSLVPKFQTRLSEPTPTFPLEELEQLARCGALAAPLPVAAGGHGWGFEPGCRGALLPLLKELGRGNLALGRIFEGHANALLLIARFGTAEQIQAAACDVLEGHAVFGVWNTGPPGKPVASRVPDGKYRLTGGKTFASGAGRLARAVVTAEVDRQGWQMFIAPLDQLSYQVDYDSWRPLGMEASESFSVDFSGIELKREAALGLPGQYYCEPFFTTGAFRFTAVQVGGAQALFEWACRYARERGSQADAHQLHRLGRMAVLVESGRQWVAQACDWLDALDGCDACLATRARMMRVAVSSICAESMQLAEQCVGARGLQTPYPFARMLRDLHMYLRQGGADQALTAIGEAACREHGA